MREAQLLLMLVSSDSANMVHALQRCGAGQFTLSASDPRAVATTRCCWHQQMQCEEQAVQAVHDHGSDITSTWFCDVCSAVSHSVANMPCSRSMCSPYAEHVLLLHGCTVV